MEDRWTAKLDGPLTFAQFVPIYVERYVKANGLSSADTIDYQTPLLVEHLGSKLLDESKQADIENLIVALRESTFQARDQKTLKVRKPATINRHISLLRHMFS